MKRVARLCRSLTALAVLAIPAAVVFAIAAAPPAAAQGCPPGFEQGYYDETIEAQRSTGDPTQCSKWVNGRSATYMIHTIGCQNEDAWRSLSGQSPTDFIYGQSAGLGYVRYENMIVRVQTFPHSNDFDLEPAAAEYARWFGPSCAAPTPTPVPPTPTTVPPTATPIPPTPTEVSPTPTEAPPTAAPTATTEAIAAPATGPDTSSDSAAGRDPSGPLPDDADSAAEPEAPQSDDADSPAESDGPQSDGSEAPVDGNEATPSAETAGAPGELLTPVAPGDTGRPGSVVSTESADFDRDEAVGIAVAAGIASALAGAVAIAQGVASGAASAGSVGVVDMAGAGESDLWVPDQLDRSQSDVFVLDAPAGVQAPADIGSSDQWVPDVEPDAAVAGAGVSDTWVPDVEPDAAVAGAAATGIVIPVAEGVASTVAATADPHDDEVAHVVDGENAEAGPGLSGADWNDRPETELVQNADLAPSERNERADEILDALKDLAVVNDAVVTQRRKTSARTAAEDFLNSLGEQFGQDWQLGAHTRDFDEAATERGSWSAQVKELIDEVQLIRDGGGDVPHTLLDEIRSLGQRLSRSSSRAAEHISRVQTRGANGIQLAGEIAAEALIELAKAKVEGAIKSYEIVEGGVKVLLRDGTQRFITGGTVGGLKQLRDGGFTGFRQGFVTDGTGNVIGGAVSDLADRALGPAATGLPGVPDTLRSFTRRVGQNGLRGGIEGGVDTTAQSMVMRGRLPTRDELVEGVGIGSLASGIGGELDVHTQGAPAAPAHGRLSAPADRVPPGHRATRWTDAPDAPQFVRNPDVQLDRDGRVVGEFDGPSPVGTAGEVRAARSGPGTAADPALADRGSGAPAPSDTPRSTSDSHDWPRPEPYGATGAPERSGHGTLPTSGRTAPPLSTGVAGGRVPVDGQGRVYDRNGNQIGTVSGGTFYDNNGRQRQLIEMEPTGSTAGDSGIALAGREPGGAPDHVGNDVIRFDADGNPIRHQREIPTVMADGTPVQYDVDGIPRDPMGHALAEHDGAGVLRTPEGDLFEAAGRTSGTVRVWETGEVRANGVFVPGTNELIARPDPSRGGRLVDADGNIVRTGVRGDHVVFERTVARPTSDHPIAVQDSRTQRPAVGEPAGVPTSLNDFEPQARIKARVLGAGPGGELYGMSGERIGRIEADGSMWTLETPPRQITGATPDGGRLSRITLEDGQVFDGYGQAVHIDHTDAATSGVDRTDLSTDDN